MRYLRVRTATSVTPLVKFDSRNVVLTALTGDRYMIPCKRRKHYISPSHVPPFPESDTNTPERGLTVEGGGGEGITNV